MPIQLAKPTVKVVGPHDGKGHPNTIVTTSNSKKWGRGLSPFILGPVSLYDGYVSQNVENAWQFSKHYQGHTSEQWLTWAKEGWAQHRAIRYPMGKGAKPRWSRWEGQKLGYIEARKHIYIPLYAKAVRFTRAYAQLEETARHFEVTLFDYDGYDHLKLGMSLEEVMYDPKRIMGHAFVLAMMLAGHVKVTMGRVYVFGECVHQLAQGSIK